MPHAPPPSDSLDVSTPHTAPPDALSMSVPHAAHPLVSLDTHALCSGGNADGAATVMPPTALPQDCPEASATSSGINANVATALTASGSTPSVNPDVLKRLRYK